MKRDIDILEHIRNYCKDIEETVERFGNDKKIFRSDKDYRNSVCMSLLQIGELSGHLTETFREETKGTVYWPAVKGMRNLFAHDYGSIETDRVWKTVSDDIPSLHKFCDQTIRSSCFWEPEKDVER